MARACEDDWRTVPGGPESLEEREAVFALPFGRARRVAVRNDADSAADGARLLGRTVEPCVKAADRSRLPDVERLASSDIAGAVDHDNVIDAIVRGERVCARAAD